jgi:hypothetical protein
LPRASSHLFFSTYEFPPKNRRARSAERLGLSRYPGPGPGKYQHQHGPAGSGRRARQCAVLLPEANAYYDVPAHRYLVQRDGRWNRYERLEGYEVRNLHPQYIDYRGNEPWTYKRGGNPHGLPPGQAKKMYRDDDHGHGKDKGHGKGHKH